MANHELKNFGSRLQYCRVHSGFTQSALAAACGVGNNSVSRWERNAVLPGHLHLHALCTLFGVASDWLEKGKGSAPVIQSKAARVNETGANSVQVIDIKAQIADLAIKSAALEAANSELTARLLAIDCSVRDLLPLVTSLQRENQQLAKRMQRRSVNLKAEAKKVVQADFLDQIPRMPCAAAAEFFIFAHALPQLETSVLESFKSEFNALAETPEFQALKKTIVSKGKKASI